MPKSGFVYLISDLEQPNIYKIGVTTGQIEKRMSKLQTGNSSELNICRFFKTDYPFKIENMMHRKYFSKKVKNEWFELSDEEALNFNDDCRRFENIILSLKDNPFYCL